MLFNDEHRIGGSQADYGLKPESGDHERCPTAPAIQAQTDDNLVHLNGFLFRCVRCAHQPDSAEALRRHLTVEHLKWLPFECLYCDVFKPTEAALIEHTCLSHPFKPVKLVVEQNDGLQQQLEHLISLSTTTTSHLNIRSNEVPVTMVETSSKCWPTASTQAEWMSVGCLVGVSPLPLPVAAPFHGQLALPWLNKAASKPDIVDMCLDDDQTPPLCLPLSRSKENGGKPVTVASPPLPSLSPANACDSATERSSSQWRQCGLCGVQLKVGRQGGATARHVRTVHLLDSPFMCKYCGRGELGCGSMRRHITAAHPRACVEAGIDDRRALLRQVADRLLKRCFGINVKTSPQRQKSHRSHGKTVLRREKQAETEADGVNQWKTRLRSRRQYQRNWAFGQEAAHTETEAVDEEPLSLVQTEAAETLTEAQSQSSWKYIGTVIEDTPLEQTPSAEEKPNCLAIDQLESKPVQCCCEAVSPTEAAVKTEAKQSAGGDEQADARQTTSGRRARPRVDAFCRLCRCVVPYGRRHTQLRHLGATLYACSACPFRCNTSAAAVGRHHERDSCGGVLLDHSRQLEHQLADLHAACFAERRHSPHLLCID